MIVSVADLRTGKPVALGTDQAGKPVYEVYSNAKGAFELYVPADLAGTVRVDARVPGATDPRLTYAVLVPPGGQPAKIDEDTALVTRFLGDSWRGRMAQLMVQLVADPPRSEDEILKGLYGGGGAESLAMIRAVLGPLVGELRTALRASRSHARAASENCGLLGSGPGAKWSASSVSCSSSRRIARSITCGWSSITAAPSEAASGCAARVRERYGA